MTFLTSQNINKIKGVRMEKNKYVGISKVGEKGQIVIPKEARDIFGIKPGDSIVVLCDRDQGIALVKADVIEDLTSDIIKSIKKEKQD